MFQSRRIFWTLVIVLASIAITGLFLIGFRAWQIAEARDRLESQGISVALFCKLSWMEDLLPGTLPYVIAGEAVLVPGGDPRSPDLTDEFWLSELPTIHQLPEVCGVVFIQPVSIGPKTVASLVEFPHLRRVILNEADISDSDLSSLGHLQQLESLSLANTNVTGAGFEGLQNLEHLVTVSLDGTPLTEEGLSVIAMLTSLQSLSLSNTPVTEKDVQILEAALPQLVISDD